MTSNRRFTSTGQNKTGERTNRIITMGLGPISNDPVGNAGPITQGFGALYTIRGAVDLLLSIAQYERGRSGRIRDEKRKLTYDDEIIVKARLIGINDDEVKKAISGQTTRPILRSLARLTVEHIKKTISINVKRILK